MTLAVRVAMALGSPHATAPTAKRHRVNTIVASVRLRSFTVDRPPPPTPGQVSVLVHSKGLLKRSIWRDSWDGKRRRIERRPPANYMG